MTRSRLIYLTLVIVTLGTQAFASSHGGGEKEEKCEKDKRMPEFSRVFAHNYDGPVPSQIGREGFEKVLGSCGDADLFAENMLDFFSEFGFDTAIPRQTPLEYTSGPSYNLTSYAFEPSKSRNILGSFYEYGEYMDSEVYNAYVQLQTNSSITLESGLVFPAGTILLYGSLRMKMDRRDVCMTYRTMNPSAFAFNGKDGYSTLDFTLDGNDWGEGSALGVAKVGAADNFMRLQMRLLMTFPAAGRAWDKD